MGQRLVVNCTGGSVHGPKINGTVIPPTGDWLFPLGEGHLRLDVRGTIKTDDGELILFEYYGMISFPKEAFDRALKGEVVTAKDGYFITAPISTASKKYPWLTEILAVGKMTSLQVGKYVVSVFVTRVIEGMSVEETSELLGIKPETVKTRLHRARQLVRDQLEKEIGPVLMDAFPFAGRRCERMTEAVMKRLGFLA